MHIHNHHTQQHQIKKEGDGDAYWGGWGVLDRYCIVLSWLLAWLVLSGLFLSFRLHLAGLSCVFVVLMLFCLCSCVEFANVGTGAVSSS